MKHERHVLLPAYRAALGRYLKRGTVASLRPARSLGRRAATFGLETLDLAQLHELAVLSAAGALPPTKTATVQERLVRRAGTFFAEAILPLEATHRTVMDANARLRELNEALDRRTRDLSASNRELHREIARRGAVEETLRKSEERSNGLLEQSRQMQDQLRLLSRRVLSAQEEERKRVSRELHDVIAQMLTGINARLAGLKKEAAANTKGMSRKISRTQRLVQRSVDIVHRFARELRPAVLDDLGLIPALHSYLKGFAKETGIRVHLTAFAGVEALSNARRTALYRVAQEALSNVASHAQASRVEVTIQRLSSAVRMSIQDDGKSFDLDQVLHANKCKRLGLLGMRERVEMVGGTFTVESAAGHGTTICAQVPFNNAARELVGS
jgi:signal transduction histidine kinase